MKNLVFEAFGQEVELTQEDVEKLKQKVRRHNQKGRVFVGDDPIWGTWLQITLFKNGGVGLNDTRNGKYDYIPLFEALAEKLHSLVG